MQKKSHTQNNTIKELELLRRRHKTLEKKHEETIKKNKEYAKNLFQTIKENTELKNNAKKDAETLTDTLSINQVLVEEIKIKDKIIKANEILINENAAKGDIVIVNKVTENEDQNKTDKVKCSLSEWTSTNSAQLHGHMLKHTGQYLCEECGKNVRTHEEWKKHEESNKDEFK